MGETDSPVSNEQDLRLHEAIKSSIEKIVGSEEMSLEERRHHFTAGLIRGVLNGLAPSLFIGVIAAGSVPEPRHKLPVFLATTITSMTISGATGGSSGVEQAKDARAAYAQQLKDGVCKRLQKRD